MSEFLIHAKEGLVLMCIGMGVVLTFLCILVWAMTVMSKVVGYLNKIYPEVIPEVKTKSKKSSGNSLDEVVVAAIAAAISRKRA